MPGDGDRDDASTPNQDNLNGQQEGAVEMQKQDAEMHRKEVIEPDGSRESCLYDIRLERPPAYEGDAALWFCQLEAQFDVARLGDINRYRLALSFLPQSVLKSVKSFIENPPKSNIFASFKKAVLTKQSISEQGRLKYLLESVQGRDKKPSDVFNDMKNTCGEIASESLLKMIWLNKLPDRIHFQLISHQEEDIQDLLLLADKYWESINGECSGDSLNVASLSSERNNYSKLEKQIRDLTDFVHEKLNSSNNNNNRNSRSNDYNDNFQHNNRRFTRNRSNSRNRSHSHDRSNNNDVCYYHRKFGDRAFRCVLPCKVGKIKNSASDLPSSSSFSLN